MDDYAPANGSNLSDDEGRALLRSLHYLSLAGEYDAETGKKIRVGSYAARAAVANLQTGLIKAAAYFEHYYHFSAWLSRNGCEAFMHEHPSYSLADLSHEFRAMRRDVDELNKSYSSLLPLLMNMMMTVDKAAKAVARETV